MIIKVIDISDLFVLMNNCNLILGIRFVLIGVFMLFLLLWFVINILRYFL